MKAKNDLPYLEWTEPSTGEKKRLYADVITSESANLGAVVTQHAIERGSKITDHYRKEPESIQCVYYFSGAPLRGDLDDDFPGEVSTVQLRYEATKARRRPGTTPLVYGQSPLPGLAVLNPFNAATLGLSALGAALGIGGLPKNVTPSEIADGQVPTAVQALTFAREPKRLEKAIELVRRLQAEGILVTVKTSFGPFEDCGIIGAEISRTPDHGTSGEISFSFEQLKFAVSDVAVALPIPLEPRALPKKGANSTGGKPADPKAPEATVAAKLANDYAGATPGSGI
jgi:Dit-like tail protein